MAFGEAIRQQLIAWGSADPVVKSLPEHYVIKGMMASRTTSLTNVYSTVHSGADQRKYLKLRVAGLCARNSRVTSEFPAQMASNAEMFPFDDVIMGNARPILCRHLASLGKNELIVSILNSNEFVLSLKTF